MLPYKYIKNVSYNEYGARSLGVEWFLLNWNHRGKRDIKPFLIKVSTSNED